jgi:hypothetical protein
MGWESRNGHGRYYTRSTRVGGRTVREYVGAGEWGEYWALEDACARRDRELEREQARREVDVLVALDHRMAAYAQSVDRRVHEALEASGYRRHQRGEWRKTRGQA